MLKLTAGRAVGILQRSVRALPDADVERLAIALPLLVQQLPPGGAGHLFWGSLRRSGDLGRGGQVR
jgi:hypothetical protein